MVAACRKAARGRRWGHLALRRSQLTFSENHCLRAYKSQTVWKREKGIDSMLGALCLRTSCKLHW